MTPEQEQWFILAIQEMRASQEEMRATQREMHIIQQNQQIQIAELREGQALLAQVFRESLDRFDERTRLMQSEMKEIRQEIRDLRRDFLEFLQR